MLGAGFGVGAIGGWAAAKGSQAKQSSHRVVLASEEELPSVNTPQTSVVNPVPPNASPADEIRSLEEKLHRTQLAYHMAKEMGQFQAGFLARTSHELRSPINSVISLHQLILSDLCEDPAEEREFVAQANTAAQKMLSLMDQLIKVAKASYGKEKLDLRPISLQDALLEVQQFTYLQARNRNLRLEIELPDDDVSVLADANWLRQVLVSLIDTPISLVQEGTIHLTTQVDAEAGFAQIWIDDERSADFWQEPANLLNLGSPSDSPSDSPNLLSPMAAHLPEALEDAPSPGLVLLVSQMLLERMGGRLDLLMIPSDVKDTQGEVGSNLTRIQCSVPIASSL